MSDTALVSFLPVTQEQAKLVLNAMEAVGSASGELRPADRDALEGAAHRVLYFSGKPDFTGVPQVSGETLAEAFPTEDYRRYVLQLIAVMAFVDGKIEPRKLDLVLKYTTGAEGLRRLCSGFGGDGPRPQ